MEKDAEELHSTFHRTPFNNIMSSSRQHDSDRRPLLGLALIAIAANASYTTIAPILPLEVDKYHISEESVSIIFLAFTFGSLLAPAMFAHYFETIGRVNVISLSMVGMSFMFWCLGHVFGMSETMVAWNDNNNPAYREMIVIGLIFIMQFFLGAFYSMITTGYYSLASLAFVEKAKVMSLVEASVGIGHIVGPIIGSVLYDERGYQYVYSFGVSLGMLIVALFTWKFLAPCFERAALDVADAAAAVDGIDNEVDVERFKSFDCSKREMTSDNDDDDIVCSSSDDSSESEIITGYQSMNIHLQEQEAPKKLSAMSLLKYPTILLAALSICWVMVSFAFLEPLLAKHLDHFHVGNKGIGFIFSLTSIVYIPATLLVQYLPSSIGRHLTISIALLLTPMCVLLVGSSSLPVVIFGIGLLGFLPAPVWVLSLPLMQDESLKLSSHEDTRLHVNDLIASIYNSFMTLGKVLGYVLGSLGGGGEEGFTRTAQTVALLIFLQTLLFYFGAREQKRERMPSSSSPSKS